AIMNNRIGNGLNFTKKLLLATAGAAALAGPIVIGIVIAAGHVPVLHAQQLPPPPPPVSTPAVRTMQNVPLTAATPPDPQPTGQRTLAMLFDCGAMTAEEQARARGAAIQFVKSNLQPRDVVSVMQASTGPVRVLQDFTNDKSLLETAISSVGAPEAP